MDQYKRLFVALLIFLSGVAMIPFISLPAQAFSWQLFADTYDDGATLTINNTIGKSGSFFKVNGEGFPANVTVTITLNGTTLGTITSDANGKFEFELNTSGAGDGAYFVTGTVNPSATVGFKLDSSSPNTWPSTGASQTFNVPTGIAFTKFVHLPVVRR